MKLLFKIFLVLFLVSCDSESGTTTGSTTNPFVGTWYYNNFELKQSVTTYSDQTTIPVMGAMGGLVPFDEGLVIQGDGNNDTLKYMFMFLGMINMDFITLGGLMESMESEGESTENPEELCVLNLMMSGDCNEDDKIEYLVMCGGSYYMGNLPEDAFTVVDSEGSFDFSQQLISIDDPVTFYYIHQDSLASETCVFNTTENISFTTDNTKTITISGSVSYPTITVLADTPADLTELQLGISLEEYLTLEEETNPMNDMIDVHTIIINEDNTLTFYEVLDYDDDMAITVLDTCFATWSLSGDELAISEAVTCTSEDNDNYEDEADYPECIASCTGVDDIDPDMPTEFCIWVTETAESNCYSGCTGDDLDDVNEVLADCTVCLASNSCNHEESSEDDDEDDEDGPVLEDEMPTISINSDGNVTYGLSTNSYCDFLGTSQFNMFEGDIEELNSETECKSVLEEILFFETGSIKSVEIAMHAIYTNESPVARINNNQNQTNLTKQQEVIINWLQTIYPKVIYSPN